jgi:hypothetical protein
MTTKGINMDCTERAKLIAAIKLMDMNELAQLVFAHDEYHFDSQYSDIGEAIQFRHDQLHSNIALDS